MRILPALTTAASSTLTNLVALAGPSKAPAAPPPPPAPSGGTDLFDVIWALLELAFFVALVVGVFKYRAWVKKNPGKVTYGSGDSHHADQAMARHNLYGPH
jgi:hypothetical protein